MQEILGKISCKLTLLGHPVWTGGTHVGSGRGKTFLFDSPGRPYHDPWTGFYDFDSFGAFSTLVYFNSEKVTCSFVLHDFVKSKE